MPNKISQPKCRRCHSTIPQPILEKDAGELVVRCLECGAGNILRVIASSRMIPPVVEIVGWMG